MAASPDNGYPNFSCSSRSVNNRSNAPTEMNNSRNEINIETIIKISANAKLHCPAVSHPANNANMLTTHINKLNTPAICILRMR